MAQVFPRNIFQVWYQGCDKIPRKEFTENVKNWKALNPDWSYQCISHETMRDVAYEYSVKCGEIYDKLPIMHMQIDLGRYLLVYMYGGLYVDMDAYVMRSIDYDPIITGLIERYEQTGEPVLGITKANVSWLERIMSGVVYNNAFMVSSPKNPCLKRYIDHVLECCEKRLGVMEKGATIDYVNVQATTGPVTYSKFFGKTHTDTHMVYIESTTIEPCDLTKVCRVKPSTIALHQFEMSWINSPTMKSFTTGYVWFLQHLVDLLFIGLVILVVFIVYRARNPAGSPQMGSPQMGSLPFKWNSPYNTIPN